MYLVGHVIKFHKALDMYEGLYHLINQIDISIDIQKWNIICQIYNIYIKFWEQTVKIYIE